MSPTPTAADPWASTHLMTSMATRVMGQDAYLGQDKPELGTPVGDHAYEMFAVVPPAQALQLQLDQVQPTYIAVHDVGVTASAQLLTELSAGLRQPLQTLKIRQQGTGITLATIRFIELPSPNGAALRLYSTAVDADTTARHGIADTLLAFSRLGVLLLGALPEHALARHLAPLRERLLTVPWNNRNLLLVPLAAAPALGDQAQRLVEGTLIQAAIAPPSAHTGPIWKAVHEAWSRLRSAPADGPRREPAPQQAARAPLPLRPMPPSRGQGAPAPEADLQPYVQACAELRGALGCFVFDRVARRVLVRAGRGIEPTSLIEHACSLLSAAHGMNARLGAAGTDHECLVTMGAHVALVRTLPRRTALGMTLVFDKAHVNPLMLRSHLQRLEPMIDGAQAATA